MIAATRLRIGIVLFALFTPAVATAQATSTTMDSRGVPAVDPTENVKALSEAANKRQDDLRGAAQKLIQVQLDAAEKLNDLRYKQTQELATALASKLADEAKLRAEYDTRLQLAEAKRIDAIRAVDVNAVAVANQRTSEQASALQTQTTQSAEVLRNQVSRSAEDLRALVATTAATALQNQQQQFAGLSARITTLEQAGAEGKGKQTFQDPVIAQLLTEFRTLANRDINRGGVDAGRGDVIGWIAAGLMFLIMLGGLAFSAMKSMKRS